MLTAEANEKLTGKGVPGLVGDRCPHRLTMMKCGIRGEDGHYAPAMPETIDPMPRADDCIPGV